MRIVKQYPEYKVCPCCREVYEIGYSPISFSRFEDPDACPDCGAQVEDGYICAECDRPTPESEAVKDESGVYCTECKSECIYCFSVVDRSEMVMSPDGENYWCSECQADYEKEECA